MTGTRGEQFLDLFLSWFILSLDPESPGGVVSILDVNLHLVASILSRLLAPVPDEGLVIGMMGDGTGPRHLRHWYKIWSLDKVFSVFKEQQNS
jgi:hypothetical protein